MFTGIITDIGTVQHRETRGDTRFVISTAYDHTSIDIGASIACNGICLTVVDKGRETGYGDWFAIEASAETLSRTTMDSWEEGYEINLERALKLGDELGGHMVSGHVDGIAQVISRQTIGDSVQLCLDIPPQLMRFMAEKGSITVNGVSLTINSVTENSLNLNIIPHTLYATNLNILDSGSTVNIEVDMIARYVARLLPC
jgi:riboflavin synthase